MTRKKAIVDLTGAVIALLIATWFVHAYSQLVDVRLRFEVESQRLVPDVCVILRDYSAFALALPLLIALVGIIMILSEAETGASIVCQCGWILAVALICFTIVAWEVPFIPIFF